MIDIDVHFEELDSVLDTTLETTPSTLEVEVGEVVTVGDHSTLSHLDYDSSGHTGFVKAVSGKGLSTNDYDNTEKQKVADSYSNKHTHSNKSILDSITQSMVNTWNTVTSKYTKPQTGIPKTDLESSVQISLGKADTSIQEHQSLSAYRTSADQDIIDATKQDKLPNTVNDRYLHTNSSTGELEWSQVSSSGGTWGSITGTLSNQTDLQTALDGKADDSDIPTQLSQLTGDNTHRVVTDTEKTTWNNKSDFSGDYNDLTNQPTIPTKTSDLTNDSGFLTEHQSLADYELNTNKVTTLSGSSTDTQYPSAKCVYDIIGNIEATLQVIRGV